ncbi:hypothetical protein BUALT_Bualt08G0085800 [Buddleja alternifolia]|uniref:TFIIS N-terminal domain-containing protein n=1 Tax=Buddleja alternifolia TaxID=168488 RepID=A0AAV6XBA6_9LAMI|nr:hypothetical protein BUALT_Bualt08G0085800 [Buddleja alternifolia]
MTLEDFFTLSEMNNGLTDPSRVRELVAVMQNERDCIVKNVGDSTRQWSAVASAIAATENMDCLDLFIQLDGLHFIDKWLKEAQKFSNDSFVEESITHLLQALQTLQMDYEKVVASGIWTTVKNLLVHNSSKVQDKARVLFVSWKTKRESCTSISDVEKSRALTDDEAGKSSDIERDATISGETSVKEKDNESTRDDPVLSTSSDVIYSGQIENAHNSDKIVDSSNGDERPLDCVEPPPLDKPTVEPPVCDSVGTTSIESCSPAVSRQDNPVTRTELPDLESPSNLKQFPKNESSPEKLGSLEESRTSEVKHCTSSSDGGDAISVTEPSLPKNIIAGDNIACNKNSLYIDSRTIDSDGKGVMDGKSYVNQRRSSSPFIDKGGGSFNHHMLHKSSSGDKSWGNPKDLGTFLSGIEDDEKVNTLDLHVSGCDLAKKFDFSIRQMNREPDGPGKKSDVELDYGIIDPLEVARQVAIEVEREVVDYREQSCSSSEKLPEGNIRSPDSPKSVSRKQSHASEGSPKELAKNPDSSDESLQSATSTENQDADETNGSQDMATSQLTEAAQEGEANEDKGRCNFDLNDEICSEDATDRLGNQFSAPVSVVSASRAAAAPGLPGGPLQFEGNLGWKGSAATSAFRRASPRRLPESDNTGGSSGISKQPQGFLDFDLNVAESVDVPESSRLPSGESSNSRRFEHLGLDLNHASEDGGVVASDWRIAQLFPQANGHNSQSSSSSKQPLKNFDLNDQPSFLNDSSDNSCLGKLSQNFTVSGGITSNDSVISIMGTRVEVNRKDFVPQTLPLPDGRCPELSFDVNLGRTGNFPGIGSVLPYAHYGYSNIPPGPTMPLSSPLYGSVGPIPYMMDSRGAPVIPQIVGSASSLPTGFSQPPYFLNMNNSTPSNSVGPSRSSFDLNSGIMLESGSNDPAGFGRFLNSGQVGSMDGQLRSIPQPSITSVGGKRKEPDNGWENYPFRHYAPPWK